MAEVKSKEWSGAGDGVTIGVGMRFTYCQCSWGCLFAAAVGVGVAVSNTVDAAPLGAWSAEELVGAAAKAGSMTMPWMSVWTWRGCVVGRGVVCWDWSRLGAWIGLSSTDTQFGLVCVEAC